MAENPLTDQDIVAVVCGEALIDLIQGADGSYAPIAGGSPKNTATALARLGVPAALVSRIGGDKFGNLLRSQLTESGVDLSLLATTHEPTTLAIASVDETGSASYSFYIERCADGTWSREELPEDFRTAKFVIIAGSLALPTPSMAETFEYLFERETKKRTIVFDPNIRRVLIPDSEGVAARMDRWITMSNIVKASSEDVQWRHPDLSIEDVAKKWLEQGPSLIAVTDGANGAYLFTSTYSSYCPSMDVEVVDTVGAGDTFTAGLVEWLISNGKHSSHDLESLTQSDLDAALDFAVRVSGFTCTQRGANPPWRHQIDPQN